MTYSRLHLHSQIALQVPVQSGPSICFLKPRPRGMYSMKKKYSCITQTDIDDKGNASWADMLPSRCFRRQTRENSTVATCVPKLIIGQCTLAYTASYVSHTSKSAHLCVRGEHLIPRRRSVVGSNSNNGTYAYLLRTSHRPQIVPVQDVQCVQGSARSRKRKS